MTLRGAEPAVAYDAWLAALARSRWTAPLTPERVPIDSAAGRVLAAPRVALAPNPPHRCAAMDGYAISLNDNSKKLDSSFTGI